jgi:hypothetical protein
LSGKQKAVLIEPQIAGNLADIEWIASMASEA